MRALLALVVACGSSGGMQDAAPRPIDAAAIDASVDAAPPDAKVKEAPTATKLAIGDDATCAVMSDTTVRCWGANAHGQLGDASKIDSATPVTPAIHGVKDLAMAGTTACALLDDGSVACWGRIAWQGKAEDTLKPAGILGVVGVTRLFVFPGRACGRVAKDAQVCWGDIDPAGHTIEAHANRQPTPVVGLDHVAKMTLDAVLRDDGTVQTWGKDGVPKTGNVQGAKELGERDGAVCALLDTGAVTCPVPHCGGLQVEPEKTPPPPKKVPPPPKGKKPKKPVKPPKPEPPKPPPASAVETLSFPPAKQLAFELGWCVVTTGNKLQCGDGCKKLDAPRLERVERVIGTCVETKDGKLRCDGKVIELARPSQIVVAGKRGCAIVEKGVACWGADGKVASVAL